MLKKLLGLSAILLVLAALAAYFIFLRPGGAEVRLDYALPETIYAGLPFEISLTFANQADAVLENAKLVLRLPPTMVFAGRPATQRVVEIVIGDVGPGSVNKQTFEVIAAGAEQTIQRAEAALVYELPKVSGAYEKTLTLDLPIEQAAATVKLTLPEKVFSGEEFEIRLDYTNNSPGDLANLRLRLEYPTAFQFAKSSEEPTAGDNEWLIQSLGKGEAGSFSVRGQAVAPEKSFLKFRAVLSGSTGGEDYEIQAQEGSLEIAAAPLALAIAADREVVRIGEQITYRLNYRNNSNVTLENVTIRAKLAGQLFSYASARSEASFRSVDNSFTWTAASTPGLAAVSPGATGVVSFTISLLSDYGVRRMSDKDFALTVSGSIESPTVPLGTAASKIVSVTEHELRVAGRLNLTADGYFRDAAAGILNSGPYPPIVNQPTRYTIHWRVKNFAVDTEGAKVTAFLQPNVRFTGTVKSSVSAKPTFNSASGQVVWELGRVAANQGVVGEPLEAVFQVEYTPAVNQVGQAAILMSESRVEGKDTFSGLTLSATADPVTTELPADTTISGDRRIRQ